MQAKMKKHIKNIISLAITVIFSLIVIYSVDFYQTLQTLRLVNHKYIIFLILFFFFIMFLRAKRWEILVQKEGVKFFDLYEIYMTSNLLNIFLPARAGDIFRGCFFGYKYGYSKLETLGTVAAERIMDGLTVVAILLMGIVLYDRSRFVVQLALIASFIFLFSFFFILWIYKNNKTDVVCDEIVLFSKKMPDKVGSIVTEIAEKVRPLLNSFVKGFETFAKPEILTKIIFYSILSWAGDCIFMYILVIAFGIKASFIISFFIISFIALSTIIPSASIYIGLYQYAFILALSLFHIESYKAFGIAVAQQGITLIVYIVVALIFVVKNNMNLIKFRKKEVENNGKNS